MASLEFETMEETQKLETGIRITGLMGTGKVWVFELFLSCVKLDFDLEFAFKITKQALETMLLSKFEEKDEHFLTGTDATLGLCALDENQEFCVEVVPNSKRELWESKTDLTNNFWIKVEKLDLL